MTRAEHIRRIDAARAAMDAAQGDGVWAAMGRYGAAVREARRAGIDIPKKYRRGRGGKRSAR